MKTYKDRNKSDDFIIASNARALVDDMNKWLSLCETAEAYQKMESIQAHDIINYIITECAKDPDRIIKVVGLMCKGATNTELGIINQISTLLESEMI